MIELLVRLIYFGIVFGLYIVGSYLSPPQEIKSAMTLDFKLLLPIFSLVFLEFFVRKLSPLFYSLSIESVRFEPKTMCIEFSLLHQSLYPCLYSFKKLSWIQHNTLILHCRFPENKDWQTYNVPELFSTTLSRDKNMVYITLQANPGTSLKKTGCFQIFGKRIHVSVVALWIKSNHFSQPHFFFIRQIEEG